VLNFALLLKCLTAVDDDAAAANNNNNNNNNINSIYLHANLTALRPITKRA
jgi:hypothetical protein